MVNLCWWISNNMVSVFATCIRRELVKMNHLYGKFVSYVNGGLCNLQLMILDV